jgi:prepilin-type N-terminal cleavage/methylation domain-containing protein
MLQPTFRPSAPLAIRRDRGLRGSAGFSLIELSVVLVLLTIVLGMGLGALNTQFQSANATVTKKRQEQIREALIAHLGAARRLPCADDPAGGVTGKEDCPATFGVLPYADLGLSRESAEDGWGNLFTYAVFADAAPACPGPGRDWKNVACFGEGKSGGFTVNDGTVGAATVVTTGAIAVIVSHGPNGLGAWTREATRNASPVGCEEAHNSAQAVCALAANNTFYRGERADVDDVVAYLNAGEAIAELARQGVVKSAPARMAQDMQAAVDTALGAVAANGCGNYAIALPTPFDPWGNAYASSTVDPSASPVYQISSSGCTAATCAPQVAAAALLLPKAEVDGYRYKQGLPPC